MPSTRRNFLTFASAAGATALAGCSQFRESLSESSTTTTTRDPDADPDGDGVPNREDAYPEFDGYGRQAFAKESSVRLESDEYRGFRLGTERRVSMTFVAEVQADSPSLDAAVLTDEEFDTFQSRHSTHDHPFPEETTYMHAHDVGGVDWGVTADAGTYVFVVLPTETADSNETLRADVSYEGVYVTNESATEA